MTYIAVLACGLIISAFWYCIRSPVLLFDRHAEELVQYRLEIESLRRARTAGLMTEDDAHVQTVEVQRRMLRSKRDGIEVTQSVSPLAIVTLIIILVVAGAGLYLQRGNPAFVDHPTLATQKPPQAKALYREASNQLLREPADIDAWLKLSSALISMGDTQKATEALQKATEIMPTNVDLWVARGEALVAHAGGVVTPSARLAFDRGSQLDPKHPGPRLYLALAWMQAARPDEALKVLEPLAKDTPPGAPWLPKVERMITGCKTMLAAGIGQH